MNHPRGEGQFLLDHHDVSVALLAATLFPGGGQLYNGQRGKAVLLLGLFVVLLVAFAVDPLRPGLIPVAGSVCFVDWVVGMVDAGLVAGRLIRREAVAPWRWF